MLLRSHDLTWTPKHNFPVAANPRSKKQKLSSNTEETCLLFPDFFFFFLIREVSKISDKLKEWLLDKIIVCTPAEWGL